MTASADIGSRIRVIRQALKMTQVDFAQKLNASGTAISEIEGGKYKPNYDLILRLGQEFNVNLNYLIYGKGEIFTDGINLTDFCNTDKLKVDKEKFLEMLWYCENSPIVQFSVMAFFSRLIQSDREAIQNEIEENKKGESKE
jgi:transcriptional regulator with XRE-family HTH domain